MDRYGEIIKAMNESTEEYYRYKKTANKIVQLFIEGVSKYLSCPVERIKLRPFACNDKTFNYHVYNIPLSIRLNEDGFWAFGLDIEIFENNFGEGRVEIIYLKVQMNINERKKEIIVKINDEPDEFKILMSEDTADFNPVHEFVFNAVIGDIINGLKDLVDHKRRSKIFDFKFDR